MNWGERMTKPSSAKTPRLFYWEEGVDAWCPVPDLIENVVDLGSFCEDGEVQEIRFKRFDMTDKEFNNLPED